MPKLTKIIVLAGFTNPPEGSTYFHGQLSEETGAITNQESLEETEKALRYLLKDLTEDHPLTQEAVDSIMEFKDMRNLDNLSMSMSWKAIVAEAWVENGVEMDEDYLDMIDKILAGPQPVQIEPLPVNRVDIWFSANVIIEQCLDLLSNLTEQQILDGLRDGTYATTLHHGEDLKLPMVRQVIDNKPVAIIVSQTTDVSGSEAYIDFNLIEEDD